jgi:phosphatidylglycerophosphate synthase
VAGDQARQAWRRIGPGALTLSRPVIGAGCCLAVLLGSGGVAAWLYIAGFLTDVADGLLARSLRVDSESGRRIDGAADVAFHLLVGVGLAGRAVFQGAWTVLAVLAVLLASAWALPRWVGVHTAIGKAVGGANRIVVFAMLLWFAAPADRPPLAAVAAVVMAVAYTYEAFVTLHELRRGQRSLR